MPRTERCQSSLFFRRKPCKPQRGRRKSAVVGEGGAIAGGLGAEKFDRTRQHLRRDESVIAKNHAGGRSLMKEGKPEPKLNQMVLVETWPADDTLRGSQGFGDVIVYRIPIGLFFAPIDLVEKQAG